MIVIGLDVHKQSTYEVPLRRLDRVSQLDRVGRWLARREQELQVRLARELVSTIRTLNRALAELQPAEQGHHGLSRAQRRPARRTAGPTHLSRVRKAVNPAPRPRSGRGNAS